MWLGFDLTSITLKLSVIHFYHFGAGKYTGNVCVCMRECGALVFVCLLCCVFFFFVSFTAENRICEQCILPNFASVRFDPA